MSPRVLVSRSPLSMRLAVAVSFLCLAVAASLAASGWVLASHPQPTLPLTGPHVESISDCAPPPPDIGTSIPTGTQGSASVPPDRNNTSSSNEHTPGTVDDLVIHANAESDPKENTLDISGSHNVFDGLLNSRSHAKVSGSWNLFRHGFDYGKRSEPGKVAFDLTGSNNCFSPLATQTAEDAPPVSPAGFPFFAKFDPDQDGNILEHFAPGTAPALAAMADSTPGPQYFVCGIPDPDGVLNGAATAPGCSGSGASAIMDRNLQGQVLERGLYFVTGRIKISASNVNATVTMVSGQQLNVNGSFQGQGTNVFNPYTDASGVIIGGLLFASQWDEAAALTGAPDGKTFPDGNPANDSPNTDKAEDALKIEGSLSRFEGIIVATNGRTEVAGEQLDFRCPVMGDRVRVNGSKNYFNSAGCVANPGLTISKTPDGLNGDPPNDGVINAGELAIFTIVVTNSGSGPATNVDIDDVFPGGPWTITVATKAGVNLAAPDQCSFENSPTNNDLHCDVASLGPGESIVVRVQRATTTADCVGDTGAGVRLDNGSATPLDPSDDALADADNNPTVNDPAHLFVKCPDTKVEKTPDGVNAAPPNDGAVSAGEDVIFTITVTALGPGTSFDVTLNDPATPGTFLPNGGLLWTLGGTDSGDCTLSGAAGSQVLTCDFGDILPSPADNVRQVTLTATTSVDECGDTITNPVKITAAGDILASNNEDEGFATVDCPALRINKKSTKAGNPFVGSNNTPGLDPTPLVTADNATFVITPNPETGTGTMTVVDNGANDDDPDYGEICISPVLPRAAPGYSIDETVAPKGYGLPTSNDPQNSGAVTTGTCASGATTVTFLDPPLGQFQILFTDLGSGETSSRITCTGISPTPPDGTPTGFDDLDETYTNLPGADPAITYSCTIEIDP